jgi:ligand-binding SRPBCC domain-containing protein
MTRIRIETLIDAPIERVFDLARDIGLHERSMAESGERAIAGRLSGPIEAGETVTWRARHFGLWWTLTSHITEVRAPTTFADEQAAGPFRSFHHRHTFRAVPGGTFMLDEWHHEAPFGPIGWFVDRLVLERHMRRLLETRNRALKQAAEDEAAQVTGSGTNGASAVATATNSGDPRSMSTSHDAIRSTPDGALNS